MNADDLVDFLLQDDEISVTVTYEEPFLPCQIQGNYKPIDGAASGNASHPKPTFTEVDDILKDLEQLIVRPRHIKAQSWEQGDGWADDGLDSVSTNKANKSRRIPRRGDDTKQSMEVPTKYSQKKSKKESRVPKSDHKRSVLKSPSPGQVPKESIEQLGEQSSKKRSKKSKKNRPPISLENAPEDLERSAESKHIRHQENRDKEVPTKKSNRITSPKDQVCSEEHGIKSSGDSFKTKKRRQKKSKTIQDNNGSAALIERALEIGTDSSKKDGEKAAPGTAIKSNFRSKFVGASDSNAVSAEGRGGSSKGSFKRKEARSKKATKVAGNDGNDKIVFQEAHKNASNV